MGGFNTSIASITAGLASTSKNVIASTDPARRSMALRC
jgi:hypothetical protein